MDETRLSASSKFLSAGARAASFLDAVSLSRFRGVCKDWEAEGLKEELWKPLCRLPDVDPLQALGQARLDELAKQWSFRRLAQQLSSQRCEFCRATTPHFFVLTCSRVCERCFVTSDRATICSVPYTTDRYLLSASQVEELPTWRVEETASPADLSRADEGVVTTVAAARAAAIQRFGTIEALEMELAERRVQAISLNKAGAFAAAAAAPAAAAAASGVSRPSASPSERETAVAGAATAAATAAAAAAADGAAADGAAAAAGDGTAAAAGGGSLWHTPSLAADHPKTNWVGSDQRVNRLRGSNYGHIPVLSRRFFEATGKRIVVEEDKRTWSDNEFRKAIKEAPAGAVVVLNGMVMIEEDLELTKPLMILGGRKGGNIVSMTVEAAGFVVEAQYALLAGLTINREMGDNEVFGFWDPRKCVHESAAGHLINEFGKPALTTAVQYGCIVDGCVIGPCDSGEGLAHRRGPLMVQNSTFESNRIFPLDSHPNDKFWGGMYVGNVFEEDEEATKVVLLNNDIRYVVVYGESRFYLQSADERCAANQ